MRWRRNETPPPVDHVVKIDGTIVISLYNSDPIRSLTVEPVNEIRAELGSTFTLKVIGVERVTTEGVRR